MRLDAIVIGAGISGLSAAYFLQKQNQNFLIFEPNKIGGFIQTEHREGFQLELGPNVLVKKSFFEKFIKELQLESSIVYPEFSDYEQFVWYDNQPTKVPKKILEFIKTDLVSVNEKINLLFKLFSKKVFKTQIDLSVFDFFKPLLGPNFLMNIFNPVMQGIYGGDIKNLSARSVFPDIWNFVAKKQSIFSYIKQKKDKPKIFMLKNGNDFLVKKITESLPDDCIRNITVENVSFNQEKREFEVLTSTGEKFFAKKVFIGTSGKSTAKLFSETSNEKFIQFSKKIEGLKFAPLVVVHAKTKTKKLVSEKAFGVLFPPVRESGFLGVMFNSQIFPHLKSNNDELLTICFGGVANPDICSVSEEEIKKRAISELDKCFGVKSAHVISVKYWKNAIPQYNQGHHKLNSEMANLENAFPGLHFIGSDIGGVGVANRLERVYKAFNLLS